MTSGHGSRSVARPQRLGAVLMHEIIGRIATGRLAEGTFLPTEPELQAEFDMSRTALREGLKAVEDRGLISIRQGRGAQVQPRERWNLMDSAVLTALLDHHPTPEIFEQMMGTRMMLEPALAAAAAQRISDADLDRLGTLLDEMAGQFDDADAFLENDIRFHQIVADAAGNLIARSIMLMMEQPLRSSRRLTNTIPRALEQGQEAHRRIYDQLRAHDGPRAEQAMHEHLRWSAAELSQRWRAPAATA